jgi:signal transduction histidine kinase
MFTPASDRQPGPRGRQEAVKSPDAAPGDRSSDGGRAPHADTGHHSPDDEVLYHLSGLLDSVKTGIISLDGEGRIRVFNAVAETLFGVSRQTVLGRPFGALGRVISFKDHGTRDLWGRLSDAVWAAGAALDLEYDLVIPKGQKRIIAYSVYPLGRLAWSVGNGVVIMLDDVTRKKELEEQITDGRKRLQAVFDSITDGIQVVDTDFRITAVNKSMTSLLGGNAAVGHRCHRVRFSNSGVCDDCPAVDTFRTGQPASIIRKIDRKAATGDGNGERVLEISTFPLLDRGNRVLHAVEYISDITDRVRLAERLEHARRLAVLGEMAARVAHEVRNPLNAITGAAHFLAAEYPDDETIQKFTSLIKRQSLRVDQVASDILHTARPLRLNRTSVNVNGVVEQALGSLRTMIEAQCITVECSLTSTVPSIPADEFQIEQAVYNVIRNAVEAMPDGGTLSVGTTEDAEQGSVRITVQDTGPGIAPANRERIFETFFTTKSQGTGLGLSIVEGVLKNHGGTISVEQPDGGGARITVSLPGSRGSSPGTTCDRDPLPEGTAVAPEGTRQRVP